MADGNFERVIGGEGFPTADDVRIDTAAHALAETVRLHDDAEAVERQRYLRAAQETTMYAGPFDAVAAFRLFTRRSLTEQTLATTPAKTNPRAIFTDVDSTTLRLRAASEGMGAAYNLTPGQVQKAIRRSRKLNRQTKNEATPTSK